MKSPSARKRGNATGGLVGQMGDFEDVNPAFYNSIVASQAIVDLNAGGRTGGLVGHMMYGDIERSFATGVVSGDSLVGGLVGQGSEAFVDTSYFEGVIYGDSRVGGLFGEANAGNTSNSYAIGNLHPRSPTDDSGRSVCANLSPFKCDFGGLIGQSHYAHRVQNSYSLMTVDPGILNPQYNAENDRVAGMIGRQLYGTTQSVVNSFFNQSFNTQIPVKTPTNQYGLGRTTQQLKTSSTFGAWSSSVWLIQSGKYPRLRDLPNQRLNEID
ncbi:MAG: hypothetical protein EA369_00525 [Bradymonadales bacterium]|nr:MAG: hypothetical protein EA369_00525 [Bradymonadales bacterium]